MEKILILCVFLAPMVMQGWCIQCYECLNCTTINANDTDKVVTCDEVPPITAPGISAACVKIVGTINGGPYVVRQCGFGNGDTCIEQVIVTEQYNVTGESCYCHSDLCNGAKSFNFNFLLTAVITAALVAIFAY
ncbi:uncharacterized protein LOC120325380 [Styela clava]|uniref:uncharacterized protein LOC120325380 n=1 Tax=Styela clava TaxID=7725 RepID=UPI001939BADC|nr:uncharacterized protein LOC120325380 [Styela clava]